MIAIYVRVSTQEQAQNGYSVEEQTERLKKYSEAIGRIDYKIYTDGGFSGGNTDRPALQELINDIKSHLIDKVIVYKLDRLSRSQLDTLYLIEKVFLANDCDFVSISENFDTSTPFGKAMIGILAVFAQLEREQIKERMMLGKQARAREGKFHGSAQVPIGYDYIDGELITNDFEKMQIIKIFNDYASGKLAPTIASELNALGYYQKNGKWLAETVRAVLKRKTYLGYTFYRGEYYKGTHEAFISEELFEKVQRMLKERRDDHLKRNRRSGKANSYLGGFLYCAKCGAKYLKCMHTGTGTPKLKYKCASRAKKDKNAVIDPNCRNKIYDMAELDNLIFAEIKKLAFEPPESKMQAEDNTRDNVADVVAAKLSEINRQIARLLDLYALNGEIPLDVLQGKIHELNDQKKKLEAELENIRTEKKEQVDIKQFLPVINSFESVLEKGNLDEIRNVIGALIDKIVINDDDISIFWKFN